MRRVASLLGLVGIAACAHARGPDGPPVAEPAARPSPASAPTPPAWNASQPVRVRLSGFERHDAVEIARGRIPAVRVTREGERVREPGREPRGEVRVAATGGEPLRVGEVRVHGEISVRSRPGGGLWVDALVDLERYVEGVLAGEISLWSASPAELEAQAIAARSYAVCALQERSQRSATPYLFADTRDQVFEGPPELGSGAEARRVAARLAAALAATRGRVLFEGERVVDARFAASCGGRTADARLFAPEAPFECLRPVECEICTRDYLRPLQSAASRVDDVGWRATLSADELSQALGLAGPCVALASTRDDGRGRWLELEARSAAETVAMPFATLRARVGEARLASHWIVAARVDEHGRATFAGRGRGHGVGLCQRGARGLAARGVAAEGILAHYFPGARVGELPR